ncbi:MAG TPA: tellurite resistance TerB family protein [Bauldia sp.]|nr:tellurite resistance TerB family protein [Bauldia sp.]
MAKPISHHEALIYAMVTLSAADRTMTDRELMKIGDIIRTMPIFADFNPDDLVKIASDCGVLLREEDGIDNMIGIIKAAIPPRLHETLYACAVEVAAADLHVDQEELVFLELLRDELEIDPLVVAAIERSARVRYRVK